MKFKARPSTDAPPVVRDGDLAPDDFDAILESAATAWDIETTGLDYRESVIGTVQIADEHGRAWVVRVEDGVRPGILCNLLTDASRRKVFHYAPFDLGFMRQHWGVRAQNVACTKVLHRLVVPRAESHSLKDIVAEVLGVRLDKQESVRRSDWTAPSLSAEQLRYATGDVEHLLALYEALMEQATEGGVSRLAEQSFEYLPVRVETERLGVEDLFAY